MSAPVATRPPPPRARHAPGDGLVDLLDRVVSRGAVVSGDLLVCLAGIELLRVDLRLLLVAVDTALAQAGGEPPAGEGGGTTPGEDVA